MASPAAIAADLRYEQEVFRFMGAARYPLTQPMLASLEARLEEAEAQVRLEEEAQAQARLRELPARATPESRTLTDQQMCM